MKIVAVITKARDMYANDDVIIPEHCGVTEDDDGYWVDVCVRVSKDSNTEAKSKGNICREVSTFK